MNEELVNRVAKAMCEARLGSGMWDGVKQDNWKVMARAALVATEDYIDRIKSEAWAAGYDAAWAQHR
jgi:hypothetical protein